jgi:hypothetical protein
MDCRIASNAASFVNNFPKHTAFERSVNSLTRASGRAVFKASILSREMGLRPVNTGEVAQCVAVALDGCVRYVDGRDAVRDVPMPVRHVTWVAMVRKTAAKVRMNKRRPVLMRHPPHLRHSGRVPCNKNGGRRSRSWARTVGPCAVLGDLDRISSSAGLFKEVERAVL